MKKNTKVGLTLIGVVVTTVATRAIMATLNSKETKEERMKKDITKAWLEIKDEVTDKLKLHKTPMLEFDNSQPLSVMYVVNELRTQGSLFDQKIVSSKANYIIHINIDNVIKEIDSYKRLALFMSSHITSIAIKQFLYHECRHIWQGQEGFSVGQSYTPYVFSVNEGHGEKPEELDANEFAYSMAKTNKERALSILQKKSQEASGKLFATDFSMEIKTFAREFNPVLRMFASI